METLKRVIYSTGFLLLLSVLGLIAAVIAWWWTTLSPTSWFAPSVAPEVYLARAATSSPSGIDRPAIFPGTPSSRQGHIPRAQLETSSCGQAGCHPDITRQWEQSMHHLASFNNPFYRKSVEYTRERQGDAGVRWCAGCHDPVLLMAGEIDGDVTPETPGADAGVTCMVCHASNDVQDLTGNGRYALDVPKVGFLEASHPFGRPARAALQVAPYPHKKGFLKPVHSQAEFCSSCHRVGLTPAQNDFHWLRGQDQFGSWQDGGASGRVARSFYTPAEAKRCQDCHMPLVPSKDAGHHGGFVRSHAFPGANTAMPALAGFPHQAALTEGFLKGSMRVDVFAAREYPSPRDDVESRWLAPLEHARLTPGREVSIDVVVRNLKVGHAFPEGVLDNKDVWLEFSVTDGRGRVLWRQGGLDREHELEPGAHLYGATLLDAAAQRIDKRNIGDFRVPLFRRVINPGQSDVVRYRIQVPEGAAGVLTIEARLRYRKVKRDYTRWVFAGKRAADSPMPPAGAEVDTGRFEIDPTIDVSVLPVVDVASDRVTVRVDDGAAKPGPVPLTASKAAPMAERWYDYGVGLLVQQDRDRARWAFSTLMDRFPDFVDGPVGLARAALLNGDTDTALEALERARAVLDRNPGARGAPGSDGWGRYTRIPALWGATLLRRGDYAEAAETLEAVARRYPKDRSIQTDLGYAYFQQDRLEDAEQAYLRALDIDPDDLAAHSMLARTYERQGRHEDARLRQQIFDALREDVSVQGLRQVYLEKHPEEALEAQTGHEHSMRAVRPATAFQQVTMTTGGPSIGLEGEPGAMVGQPGAMVREPR